MKDRRHLQYKNKSPEKTVEYIQSILQVIGVRVKENWIPQSSAQTYSLRLLIEGTKLGSNGKGMTREYAKASAYAELMERMQNYWMVRFYFKKNDLPKTRGYYVVHDEKKMSTQEVAALDFSFNNMLFESCCLKNPSIDERIRTISELQKLEYELTGERDVWTMVPFYSIRTGALVYLPYTLYTNFYGSNGMCAGNTPGEAIIQGLSEIIERYVQRQVIQNSYILSSIPDDYICRYPEIKKKIQILNEMPGYKFVLKDCSVGGKYPVVALASIELNTGFYGLKFGCHPDIEIAIERAITETSQGIDFKQYCKKSKLNFKNDIVTSEDNFSNIYRSGRGQYPYELFLDTPTFKFSEVNSHKNKSDEELLKYLIDDVIGDSFDIYIRDSSGLGFPSYHIIVPFMSEMNKLDLKTLRNMALKISISSLVNDPKKINLDNVAYLDHTLNAFGLNDMYNSITSLSETLLYSEDYPAEDVHLGWLYMLVMCRIMQKKYTAAYQYMLKFYSIYSKSKLIENRFYIGLLDYLQGMEVIQNHNKVIVYLKQFYSKEVWEKLDYQFCDASSVFSKQYPIHNKDRKSCELLKCCDFYQYLDIVEEIHKHHEEKNIEQMKLRVLLSGICD